MTDWIQHPTAVPFSQDAMNDPYGTNAKALSAGRELDALVAEKIFGWTDVREQQMWSFSEDGQSSEPDGTWWAGIAPGTPRYEWGQPLTSLRHYSTDITSAWLVFLHCCKWVFSKRSRFLAEIHMQAITNTGDVVAWPDVLVVLRHRMPEVICLAALATTAP